MAEFTNVPYSRQTGYTVKSEDWNAVAQNTQYLKEVTDTQTGRIAAIEGTVGSRNDRADVYSELAALEQSDSDLGARVAGLEGLNAGTRLTTLEGQTNTLRGQMGAWPTGVTVTEAMTNAGNRLNQLEEQTGVTGVPFGSFYQSTSQSIQFNSTNERLVWDTADGTPTDVSRLDGNRVIRLGRAGIWIISVFARLSGNIDGSRMVLWLGPPDSGTADRWGFSMLKPESVLQDPGCSFTIQMKVASGFQFSAYLYQATNAARQTQTSYRSTAITCAYLGAS